MPSTNQIINSTDIGRKQRSHQLKWKHSTTLLSKDRRYVQAYIYLVHSQTVSGRIYTVTIRPQLPTDYDFKGGQKAIVCNCSCSDFKFREEVPLHTSSNARIISSNGMPEKITNPTNKKYYCKHILAVINDCLEKNKRDVQKLNIINQNKSK